MVSTHLKNISQIGSFPRIGVKIKNLRNHRLDYIYLHGYFGLPPNAYFPRNIRDYQKGQWWQLWFGHPLTRPYLLGVVVAALRGTLTYSHEFWKFDWGWDVLGIDSAWIKLVQWNQVMNKQVAVILIFWLKEDSKKTNVVVSIYLKNIQQSGLFPQVSRGENVQRYSKTHHPNQDSHHPNR